MERTDEGAVDEMEIVSVDYNYPENTNTSSERQRSANRGVVTQLSISVRKSTRDLKNLKDTMQPDSRAKAGEISAFSPQPQPIPQKIGG